MSVSLSKISDMIVSNNLCYYKVPSNYNPLTDTHSYMFTVAANNFDGDFNSHLFYPIYGQPNSNVPNDTNKLYKRVLVISGTEDSNIGKSRYGIDISEPLGLVRSNEIIYDTINAEDSADVKLIGFSSNNAQFSNYSTSYSSFKTGGMYHGVVTENIVDQATPQYRTFIAFIRSLTSEGYTDEVNSFYIIGATTSKLTSQEVETSISNEFKDKDPTVINLNSGNSAQMYVNDGASLKIPSGLPNDYSSHSEAISNAIVLWEKVRAYVPESSSTAPSKKYSYVNVKINASNPEVACYIESSSKSARVGSILSTGYFSVYDLKVVPPAEAASNTTELWLRIGDPREDNNCWIKFINTSVTPVTAQTQFSFRLDNSSAYTDKFTWEYAVVSTTNDSKWGAKNDYSKIVEYVPGTQNTFTGWKSFKWTTLIDSEGDDIDTLSDFVPASGEYVNPNAKPSPDATWVSDNNNYRYLYIRAISNSPDGLLPYKILSLSADVAPISITSYYDSVKESNCYVFRYIVEPATNIEVATSTGATTNVSVNKFYNLEITPNIAPDIVKVYGKPKQTYDPNVNPLTIGTFEFHLVGKDGNEVLVPQYEFPRGSTIRVHVTQKNGWKLNGPNVFDVTLPMSGEYTTYVISASFSRRTDTINVIIINTDITRGTVKTSFDNTSQIIVTRNGNEEIKTISCFADDELTLTAIPISLNSEGEEINIGTLSGWEYEYNIDSTTTEWRLLNNIHNYTFNVNLWQSEGSNILNKTVYKYRAIWGHIGILY